MASSCLDLPCMSSSLLCVLYSLLPDGKDVFEGAVLTHVRVFHVRDYRKPTSSPTEIK